MRAQKQTVQEGVALLLAAALLAIALVPASPNVLGELGNSLARILNNACGVAAWWWPVFLVDLGWRRIHGRHDLLRVLKAIGLLVLGCVLLDWVDDAGGRLGSALRGSLVSAFGVGTHFLIALVVCWLVRRWLGATQIAVVVQNSGLRLTAAWQAAGDREVEQHGILQTQQVQRLPAASTASHDAILIEEAEEPDVRACALPQVERVPPPPLPSKRKPERQSQPELQTPVVEAEAPEEHRSEPDKPAMPAQAVAYVLPPVGLLKFGEPTQMPDDRALNRIKLQLEEQLAGFGVGGVIDGLGKGPLLATFEFQPKAGTPISKIKKLGDNLAMAVERGVRIIAPLPNTARIGFEVPYAPSQRAAITLRSLLEHPEWASFRKSATLPMAMGQNSRGQPVFCDLAQAPHLLIAGTTGSGKSVSLSVMLTSLLLSRSPDDVRFVMIDPKIVELGVYAQLAHLIAPVVNEMTAAGAALEWVVGEMERRYALMAESQVNDIESYNAISDPDIVRLPRIVVVLDEFGDLMLVHRKQVEPLLTRLAQKARAAGVHLLLATQRPSADVITGVIKANLPCYCALKVTSRINSEVILGTGGAEHLLGRGDALCLLPGSLDLQRVHGAFVSRDEVRAVCAFIRQQAAPQYVFTAGAEKPTRSDDNESGTESGAALYARALEHVQQHSKCSISQLQRHFDIGYNRAAKLIERMEAEGIVGPEKPGGGKRDVLRRAS